MVGDPCSTRGIVGLRYALQGSNPLLGNPNVQKYWGEKNLRGTNSVQMYPSHGINGKETGSEFGLSGACVDVHRVPDISWLCPHSRKREM